jgi:cell division protease FtsH
LAPDVSLERIAAETLVYGVVTTGAENDFEQVTEIARHMVLRWGMSEKLGPISFVALQDEGLPPAFQHQPYSETTAELIDAEVLESVPRIASRGIAARARAGAAGCGLGGAMEPRHTPRRRFPA